MTYEEIIALPNTLSSIDYIEDFLSLHTINEEYVRILKKKIEIYFQNDLPEKGIKTFQELSAIENIENSNELLSVNELIKDYYLVKKQYRLALPFIEKSPNAKIDLIEVLIYYGRIHEAKNYLIDLNDIENEKLARFREIINQEPNVFFEESLREIKRKLDNHEYDFEDLTLEQSSLEYQLLLIKKYIALNDLKRASIIQTEIEEAVDKIYDLKVKREFYETFIRLYEMMFNQISVDYYQEKLQVVVSLFDEDSKFFENRFPVSNSIFREEENVHVDELYRTIDFMVESLKAIFTKSINNSMQENFRETISHLSRFAVFNQAILTMINNQKVTVIDYKKNLSYDYEKTLNDLENTVEEKVIFSKEEVVLSTNQELSQYDEIIKKKPLQSLNIAAVIGFPLIHDECYGSIVFYGSNEMTLKNFNYETLLFFSQAFNFYLVDYNDLRGYKERYRDFETIFVKNPGFIKYMKDDNIYLNEALAKSLGLNMRINVHDFIVKMKTEYVYQYREAISQLDKEVIKQLEFVFESNDDRWFKEFAITVRYKGVKYVISHIEDITEFKNLERTKSFGESYCPLTELKNRQEAVGALDEAIKTNRFSLMLLDVDRFKYFNDVFGSTVGDKVLREIAKVIKEYYQEHQVFRLTSDEILILFKDTNDSRTVQNRANKLLLELEYRIPRVNKSYRLKYSMGLFRYPIQSKDKNPEKILKYAYHAVNIAKRSKKNIESSSAFFDLEDYQDYQAEQLLINQVSDAIDNNQMVIRYQQVIDIEKNRIIHYEAQSHLPSYAKTDQYVYEVAIKRGVSYSIDRFLIQKTLQEIKDIFDKTKKYIKVSMPIHVTTFMRNDFLTFLENEVFKKELKADVVMLEVLGKFDRNQLSTRIIELKDLGFKCIINEFSDFIRIKADYFKIRDITAYLTNEHSRVMLSQINELAKSQDIGLIVADVKKREDIQLLNLVGVKFVEGALYGKRLSMEEILSKMGD